MKTILCFVFVLGTLSAADELVEAELGSNIKIKCRLSTNNKDMIWKLKNEIIFTINGKSGAQLKGKHDVCTRSSPRGAFLYINSVQEGDLGPYTCSVLGESSTHHLYTVTASVSTSGGGATLQCQVRGLLPEQEVQWEKPDGSLVPRDSTVHLTPRSSDQGTWQCTFSFEKNTYKKPLTVKMEAPATTPPSKLMPRSSATTKQTCHNCLPESQPGNSKTWLGLTLWMWVGIGSGCLVLIVLVVSLTVLHQRTKRMKRRLRKLNTMKQPLKTKQYCQCERPAAKAGPPPRGRPRQKPSTLPRQL